MTASNLSRAAFEGATFGLRYALDVLRRNGIVPDEIRLVGGGARSPLWRNIVANVFDCPVVCPVGREAGALGAAIQTMWCYLEQERASIPLTELTDKYVRLDPSTRIDPTASEVEIYSQIYQTYLQLSAMNKRE
jgi:xylulokinase